MLRFFISIVAVLFAASSTACAQEVWRPAPEHLTIGYADEGKVDASPAACDALVREVVEWTEDEIKHASREVCAARKRHVDAYAAIQKSYKALIKHMGHDHRLDPGAAVASFAAMIRACIDHKTSLTTGGHNIVIDIIPNDIAARCLKIGKSLLDSESEWFNVGYTDARPAP